jgi:hypothetical protein
MTARRLTALAALALLVALVPSAPAAAPSDPQAAAQEPLRIMRVPQALDRIARPLADVPVLVADTGLDLDHPDIAARLFALPAAVPAPDPDGVGNLPPVAAGAPGWDLIGAAPPDTAFQPDPDPSDPLGGSGHGTLVAGLLGGAWNNGQGGAGVAPNARFVALRTCWDGDDCYQYAQAAAVDWAAARGVRVASFSWLSGPLEDGFRRAILSHPGTLFVTIPSGNGGAVDADPDDPQPCALDASNVLCVSTSAPDDGLDCGAYGAHSVDVAVPTRNSVTTANGGGFVPTGCATSFAAPTAAGVATILFGIDPSASAADVRAAIVDSARKAAPWQGRSVSGGIVDAAAAVALFQQRRGIAAAGGGAGGGGGGGRGGSQRDHTKPRLAVRRSGRRLTLTLSERATVRAAVKRALPGRRYRGMCRRPAGAPRRARRCRRWTLAATLPRADLSAGVHVLTLPARNARGRRLAAGAYRADIVATDAAGNRSTARRVAFRLSG